MTETRKGGENDLEEMVKEDDKEMRRQRANVCMVGTYKEEIQNN